MEVWANGKLIAQVWEGNSFAIIFAILEENGIK